MQIEVKLVGSSRMLFNPEKMKGIDARIVKLAEREGRISRPSSPETGPGVAAANGSPHKAAPAAGAAAAAPALSTPSPSQAQSLSVPDQVFRPFRP